MRRLRKSRRRDRRGTMIVEFALIVPFFFIVIFGIIDFSRAYSQLNAINAGLREGARFASVQKSLDPLPTAAVRARVAQMAGVFGYNSLNTATVSLTLTPNATAPEYVTVTVTAHPVPLPVLGRFLGLSPFTLTRSVTYRWERAGGTP